MPIESKFCLSSLVGVKVKFCGVTTIECGQGYVIDVVEVEKGDTSTCFFTYNECSDETIFNQESTDLMREHCNGKRKCDTYKVEDEEERAVKTVYNCIKKRPTKTPTKPRISTYPRYWEPTTESEISTEPSLQTTSTTTHHISNGNQCTIVATVAGLSVAAALLLVVFLVLLFRKWKASTISTSSNGGRQNTQVEAEQTPGGEALSFGGGVPNTAEESAQYINIVGNDAQIVNLHEANEGHYEKLSEQTGKETYTSLKF